MLHGGGPDRRSMIGSMEPIFRSRNDWLRIYPDLPGMGKTPGPEWITNSDQMLDVVLEFIGATAPEQRFALIGDSYGGYLARGITHRRPRKVAGLLLICPVITDLKERILPKHATLVRKGSLPTKAYPQETKMFQSFAVVQTPRTFKRTLDEILPGLKIADNDFLARIQTHGYTFTFDPETHVFENPTLIIVGRQDSMVGYQNAWNILEKYPRATYAVLDQAGHNLQIEQERLFNALVTEWLNRIEHSESCKEKTTKS